MRAARLRRSTDIALVRAEGRSYRRDAFIARARRTAGAETRLAVTAPVSVGPAVVRNRARRRVREAFRLAAAASPDEAGLDLLVTARREALAASFAVLRRDAAAVLAEAVS